MPKTASRTSEPVERIFDLRMRRSEDDLLQPLHRLYGHLPEYDAFIASLRALLLEHWQQRPDDLRDLDLRRDLEPEWFLSEKMVGYVFYVDRFAGNLRGVSEHIGYLQELGVTYVHFMPCLMPRPGANDGGYSVMDYDAIDPRLGSMDDLEDVARQMRESGISLCIDLVLNHTAKEHEWARRARQGDKTYQAYYHMFDSPDEPLEYERTLVEIFPNDAPGNFTFYADFGKHVWTTFNEHQWDLNWSNPQVFLEIIGIMLNLANRGVEVLRLDAVAFMWKQMGTNCQNLPEVHDILQALRAATRIAAPAVIHKAEAIVAPRDLVPYLGAGRHRGREANLAYHNNLMVHYWAALATRDTRLMTYTLRRHFPERFRNACWATYVRCHDDIGWAITEEDSAAIPHTSGFGHRRFLADFYAGQHPGSFARGALFQDNPATGDRRNCGSFASLAGMEQARLSGEEQQVHDALDRMLLGVALMSSFGGVPLFYMGDEIGLLNDYDYVNEPAHAHDARWMHRPLMQWHGLDEIQLRVLDATRQIIARRKSLPALAASHPTRIVDSGVQTLFCFVREGDEGPLLAIFNFSPLWQNLPAAFVRAQGLSQLHDALSDHPVLAPEDTLRVPPHGRLWLV